MRTSRHTHTHTHKPTSRTLQNKQNFTSEIYLKQQTNMCTMQDAQQPSLSELDDDIFEVDDDIIDFFGGNPFDSMVTRDGDASPTFDELAADIANGTGDTHPELQMFYRCRIWISIWTECRTI